MYCTVLYCNVMYCTVPFLGHFWVSFLSFWVTFGSLWGSQGHFWASFGVLLGYLGLPGWGPCECPFLGASFSPFFRKGSRGREPRDPPGRPRGRLGVETDPLFSTFGVQMLKPHWLLVLLEVLMLKHQPLPRGNHTEKVVLDPPHVVFLKETSIFHFCETCFQQTWFLGSRGHVRPPGHAKTLFLGKRVAHAKNKKGWVANLLKAWTWVGGSSAQAKPRDSLFSKNKEEKWSFLKRNDLKKRNLKKR